MLLPAFPEIIRALGVHQEDAAWLISAFTIPGLLFTPVTGFLSDRYGRRKILILPLPLGIAGGACFFARDFRTLIFLRFLGRGRLGPAHPERRPYRDFFKGNDRSAAMGYNTSVIGVGTAIYPALEDCWPWRFGITLFFWLWWPFQLDSGHTLA